MSITQTRNFIEKSGCGWIVGIALAIVFLLGIIVPAIMRGKGDDSNQQQTVLKGDVIAKVGAMEVTTMALASADQSIRQQMEMQQTQMMQNRNGFEGFSVDDEVRILGSAVEELVRQAAILNYAQTKGVRVDIEAAKKEMMAELETQIDAFRAQAVAKGELKAGATAEEFAAYFKKQSGRELKDIRAEKAQELDQKIAEPAVRQALLSMIAQRQLIKKAEEGVQVSDEDAKKSANLLTVKRIFVPTGDNAKATIDKAAAELKGGASFESLITKYSKDLPEPKKTLAESVQNLPYRQVITQPALAPLKTLAVGATTGALQVDNGFAIYKLIKITDNTPKDFDKQKATIVSGLKSEIANAQVSAEIEKVTSGSDVTYTMKPFQALAEAYKLLTRGGLSGEALVKKCDELTAMAKTGGTENEGAKRAGQFAIYILSNLKMGALKPDEKKKYADERIEVLTDLLQFTESPKVRLELVNLFIEKKDKAAADQLIAAAQSNSGHGPLAQRTFSDIAAILPQLQKEKLIDEEQLKKVQEVQKQWADEKREQEKAALEEKKRMEEERKKAEEEAKKEEAKRKAEEAAAKKDAKAPTPPSGPSVPLKSTDLVPNKR